MNSTTAPTTISRRRALTALSGIGLVAVAGAGRPVAAQEGAGSGPGVPVTTAQDAAGPVVVASGSGSASAPADRVLIQLIARYTDYYGKGYGDPAMPQPAVEGTPIAGPAGDLLQAAVDVLTEAGITEDDILVLASDGTTASSIFGPGAGMVGAQVTGEQLESLPEIVREASAALTEQGLIVDQPMAMFLADGCNDLRGEALTAAVAAAREDAEALAAALGVEITTLHRATEHGYAYGPYAYVSGPSDRCDALPELADLPRTYLAPYDPSAPLEFTVTASIELTMNVATPEA